VKKSSFAKLNAHWQARLAFEGFDDLENPADPDAPLSNRGKLHSAGGQGFRPAGAQKAADSTVGDVGEDMVSLSLRVEHGSAWTTWAMDVHRAMPTNNASQRFDRRVWGMWANGESMKAMARGGLKFHVVRDSIHRTEERFPRCPVPLDLEKTVRQIQTPKLVAMLRALLVSLATR
jgi:hypothetical protein